MGQYFVKPTIEANLTTGNNLHLVANRYRWMFVWIYCLHIALIITVVAMASQLYSYGHVSYEFRDCLTRTDSWLKL